MDRLTTILFTMLGFGFVLDFVFLTNRAIRNRWIFDLAYAGLALVTGSVAIFDHDQRARFFGYFGLLLGFGLLVKGIAKIRKAQKAKDEAGS